MPAPWQSPSSYSISSLLPPTDLTQYAGPLGPAYVQVYDDGRTASGWGEKTFMQKYMNRAFHANRAKVIYERHDMPFALVMRSVRLVCIDIDGKNGGYAGAAGLVLPATMGETSKSGDGYHLFYTVDDEWDDVVGFGAFRDRIAMAPGVDFRGVGCVFHYPWQMWNDLMPVPLPQHVADKLLEKSQSLEQSIQHIQQALDSEDPEEILMMQDHVTSRLTTPIPEGKRNNTLFAIGAEMNQAQIPNWEKQIYDRAIEVGLSDPEATKIIANVRRYGT